MQYKNMGLRSRIIATLLGYNLSSFQNFESELFQTPVVPSGFKSKTSLTCWFNRYLSPQCSCCLVFRVSEQLFVCINSREKECKSHLNQIGQYFCAAQPWLCFPGA